MDVQNDDTCPLLNAYDNDMCYLLNLCKTYNVIWQTTICAHHKYLTHHNEPPKIFVN